MCNSSFLIWSSVLFSSEWTFADSLVSSPLIFLKVLRLCKSVNYCDRSSIVELIMMVQIRKQIQKMTRVQQMVHGNGSGVGGSGISSDSSVGILYLWKNLLMNLPSKFSKRPPSPLVRPTFNLDLF